MVSSQRESGATQTGTMVGHWFERRYFSGIRDCGREPRDKLQIGACSYCPVPGVVTCRDGELVRICFSRWRGPERFAGERNGAPPNSKTHYEVRTLSGSLKNSRVSLDLQINVNYLTAEPSASVLQNVLFYLVHPRDRISPKGESTIYCKVEVCPIPGQTL